MAEERLVLIVCGIEGRLGRLQGEFPHVAKDVMWAGAGPAGGVQGVW